MFVINEDLSIYCTRGDAAVFSVGTMVGDAEYTFQIGDVVRFKVFAKKDCSDVVLIKNVTVEEESTLVEVSLEREDTTIGDVISKPVDYWYEVELNPETYPQTIIGYDDDGAKVFRLLPEGGGEVSENASAGFLRSLIGKSAYEVAVANGFEGTEEEWLDSLKYKLTEADKDEITRRLVEYITNGDEVTY